MSADTEAETEAALAAALDRAVAALRAGGLVAVPTETVYGLAADAENEAAVGRIFAVKGRPRRHPLIVHVADASALEAWGTSITPEARRLAARFWPGPLTLVVRRAPRVPLAVTGGLETVALRVPAHPLTLELLRRFGGGIAAPSANRFGAVSPTTADHVREDLGGEVDVVLDGGPCAVGVESTIVDVSGEEPVVLRPGGLGREEIEAALGRSLAPGGAAIPAPGNLPSHYAPRARVLLVDGEALVEAAAARVAAGERTGALLLGPLPPQRSGAAFFGGDVEVLALPEGEEEEARALYAALRELDRRGCDVIVTQLPANRDGGLGWAIADRLRKAAGPRG
jgi:L-threonylcarbamoyladenylate synthase